MFEFPINPRSKKVKKRGMFGVGTNDADYVVEFRINGKNIYCPFYQKWKNMLKRCYNSKNKKKQPTYVGCTVCEEWLLFSNFREWMAEQDWEGKQLDKDILDPGNTLYCNEKCVFVPQSLNVFLIDRAAKRGNYPIGVCFNKRYKKYQSNVTYNGKLEFLGYFDTTEEAHSAYVKRKSELFDLLIKEYDGTNIGEGLKLHLKLLKEGNDVICLKR